MGCKASVCSCFHTMQVKAHCIPVLIPLDTTLIFKFSEVQIRPAKKIHRRLQFSAHNAVISHGSEPTNTATWGTNPAHLVREGGSLQSMSEVQILNFCWNQRLCRRNYCNILPQDYCKCNVCFLQAFPAKIHPLSSLYDPNTVLSPRPSLLLLQWNYNK